MASLTGQTVSSTYDGLLKTDDNDILGAAPKEITDGLGNGSGMTLSTTGDVSIAGDLTVDGAILDSNGVPGASGQILSSTVTGTDWVSLSEISGVDGTGTANYIAKWTDGDTIGNSVIYDNGTNVGIGTSSPSSKLEVNGNAIIGDVKVLNYSTYSVISSKTDDDLDNRTLYLTGGGDASGARGSVIGLSGNEAGGNLNIIAGRETNAYVNFLTGAGSTERMRIDSSGNVGIGTSSPQVIGAGNTSFTVAGSAGAGTIVKGSSVTGEIYASDAGGGVFISAKTNHPVIFRTNDAERMRIDSSGNVKIGDYLTDVTSKLTVSGNGSSNLATFMYDGNAGTYLDIDCEAANGVVELRADARTGAYPPMVFTTGATERMRITSTGNVGIGTSSPSAKLHSTGAILSSGGLSALSASNIFIDQPTSALSRIGVVGANTSTKGSLSISQYSSNGSLGSDALIIDSAGNVGIGTSSPSAPIHAQRSDDGVIGIFRGTSNAQLLLGINGGNLSYDASNGSATHVFNSNGTERMRLQSNGDLHVDGDVIAYSTTISDQRLKDDVQTIDNALDKVSNLRGVSYTWNNGNRKGQKDLGLIAQEVEQVLPELVREKEMPMIDGGTYKTVDYEKIVGVLIEAVKELKAEIEILKSK